MSAARVRGPAFGLLALSLLACGLASARQGAPAGESQSVDRVRAALDEHNRAAMHPGNPLKIVGLDEAAHDARASTPALANSDRKAPEIQQDEAARRTRAIYENGASFHEPLPRAKAPGAAHVAGKGSGASSSGSRAAPALVCGVLAALAVILLAVSWSRNR